MPTPLAITLSPDAAATFTRLATELRADYLALHQAVGAVADAGGQHADARLLRRAGPVAHYALTVGRNELRYEVDLAQRIVTVQDVVRGNVLRD